MSQRSRAILGAVLLLVLTASAYFPVVSCGFIWDDDAYVERNGNLQGVRGLYRIWFDVTATPQYYPMVHTTYWFEYQLWELKPAGFHVTNVLLHWIAAVLLWRILSLLNVPGAWLIAAVFGLHPVHVESVAWITERKNVLSAVFYLGSALAYLRCKLGSGSRWLSTVSLLLFVAALLSKTVTATLPAALLLILWWKRERLCREDVRELLPFFALSLAFGMLTAWLEVHHVGALGDEWSLTFLERTLLAGKIVCFYIWKLLWPSNLTFIYERWNANFHSAWQLAFPAAVTAVLLTLWGLRNRLGRGPLVAVLFFIGTLFPALDFFDVYPMRYSFVADHFQYLASIGIIALVIGGAARLLSQAPRRLRS
ncbi:MAG: O-GlcNAc transferase, partial [bacterium]|nr:O-GlcNAc transferase [bacterium]